MAEERDNNNHDEAPVSGEVTTSEPGDGAQGPVHHAAGNPAVTGEEVLHQEIEALQTRLAEATDGMLRVQAEMDNLRKRTTRDIENAHKFALDRFIRDLLPVVDSMELGINASQNAGDIGTLREGMDLTLKMFFDILGRFGVTVIDPQGQRFDPEKHEAVSMQDGAEADANTVLGVMQKGYELNGRLVRPAMVIVAR